MVQLLWLQLQGAHLPVVKSFQHGASRDIEGERYSTALEAAVSEGHLEVAECLLVDRGDPVTEEVLIAAVEDSGDREPVACVIENARNLVEINQNVMIAAVENEVGGDDIMAYLLNRCRNGIDITEELLVAAAQNRSCGDKIIALLSKRGAIDSMFSQHLLWRQSLAGTI